MTHHNPKSDPHFARESFTFRGMKTWQIGGLIAFAVLAVIVGLAWL
jgi:hypothetical protein